MSTAIDLLVAGGLVWLALQAVRGPSLFRSIIMFIVFGLVMALAWARLRAPDLVLAEAAIGAGLTGALLLGTYRRLYEQVPVQKPPTVRPPSRLALPVSVLAAALVAAIGLGALTLELEPAAAGLLAESGRSAVGLANPVTAVLLAFRGWDTLLEMTILLVAFAGARAVTAAGAPQGHPPVRAPLVSALLSSVVPLTVLAAAYLLHAGGHAPGGAFQGGAVLAAGGVLLVLTGRLQPVEAPHWIACAALVAGVLSFGALGIAGYAAGGALLELPGLWAVYAVETMMTVSIAAALMLLFAGGGALGRGPR